MYKQIRWDHDLIFDLVETNSSVLDLGCGNGELLARLSSAKGVTGQAVEVDPESVASAIGNGVAVYQKDLDRGLPEFKCKSYDYVILEKTLQQLQHPLAVLKAILRIGKICILTFPNFNYRGVVDYLLKAGRMPITASLPHQWYNTPNIHLFTLADFLDWVNESGVKIVAAYAAEGSEVRHLDLPDDNYAAEELLFVLKL